MTHRHQRLNRFLRPQRFLSWLCLGLLISLLSAIIADRSLGSIAPSASGPVLEEVAQNSLEADIHDAFAEGEQAYEQQDYGTAIALWQSLLPQANLQQQVALLNNISLAQQALRQWSEAEQTIRQSLTLLDWQAEDSDPSETTLLASALDIYGQWLYHQGQTEAALDLWVQAEQYYPANTPNILGAIVQNQLNQAQALQYLGRHLDSQTLLSNLHAQLQNPPLNLSVDTQLDILLNFGRILRLVGNLDNGTPNALAILQDAEKLVADSNSNRLSALQLELGNIQQAIAQYYRSLAANSNRNSEADGFTAQAVTASTAAINHYQQAISTATEPLQRIQAQLNQLSLLINAADHRGIGTLVANLQQDLEQLSLSDRPSLQARLAFARQALKLREMDSPYAPGGTEIANLLVTVINQAKTLNDTRLISSAWGSLGHLYEINYQARGQKSDLPDALNATSNGLTAILNEQQPEQSYRLHWQLGRILKVQGETEGAIAAYDAAIKTIQSLRRELVILNPDIQFSFRQDIEPVYREFADLLLKEGQPSQENLKHAREVIDSLQTLEVENYLRQSCSNATLGKSIGLLLNKIQLQHSYTQLCWAIA
jgi:tetratricopeptide (TPR) repeat protein